MELLIPYITALHNGSLDMMRGLASLLVLLVAISPLEGGTQQNSDGRPVDAKSVSQQPKPGDLISELRKKWPNNRIVNIVAFGNSVPAGYAKTPEVRPFDAYPHLLHQHLNAVYPHAVINVIVSAAGGETSEEGLARMDATVLNHSPDVLLVDYGLNDRKIGTERSRNALTKIVRKAKSVKAIVIMLTPTGETDADLRNVTDPLNLMANMIRDVARQEVTELVDSTAAFREFSGDSAVLYAQNNHPSRAGHEIVAEALMKRFQR